MTTSARQKRVKKNGPLHEGPGEGRKQEDDGGPVDKSVLTSFKTHITYAIWNKEVAWINDHFSECVRVVPNMEYTELMPRMCKWKAQQCCGDTHTALIVLREKIDDLTEIDQVEVDGVIAFLQGAFSNGQVEDNSSVTYEALKMLLDARKTEKAQGNIPAMESRRKRQHEPTNTTAVTKGKAISKKKPKK
ncbi:hypothetical protein LguiA_026595 [Lonicera macranthoides]